MMFEAGRGDTLVIPQLEYQRKRMRSWEETRGAGLDVETRGNLERSKSALREAESSGPSRVGHVAWWTDRRR